MIRTFLVALLGGFLLAGSAPAVPGAAAGAKAPAPPRAVAVTLDGTALAVTWRASTGRVEVRIRNTAGKRTTSRVRSTPAKRGTLAAKVSGPRGAALGRSAVRVRVRRCTRAGPARRCSRWSRWRTPAAPKRPATPSPSPSPAPAGLVGGGAGPRVGACPMLPATHAFNQDVSALPVDPRSNAYIASIGLAGRVHPDFGAADLGQGPGGFGIPYRVVPATQPLVTTIFGDYADESDAGPYPVPLDSPIEGGPASDGDRHVLVVREGECKLYEMGNAYPRGDHWEASGGAIWDLNTGAPRPARWTSADAAGLPILPGLARYDEVAAGAIHHALRFTVSRSQRAYIAPASHWASASTDETLPPMGLRLRMRADYDLSGMTGQSLIVATALKRYGMIVADNGSDWYISGAPDERWDDEDLNQLKRVPGSAFEVVQTGSVVRP